jgi:SpoIIAA-like
MIEILSESEGNVLGIRAEGKVTDSDYRDVFIPPLAKIIEDHGKARVLYCMDASVTGFEMGAMWQDASFGIKHRNDFEKIAVVGGPGYVEWGTKIAAHLVGGEVKTFSDEQLQEAWTWVKS